MKNRTMLGIDTRKTGQNIRKLRLDRGLSAKDVQRYIGFDTPTAVYDWEKGKYLPKIDHFIGLSDLFEISINDIIVRIKPKNGSNNSNAQEGDGDPKIAVPYRSNVGAI